MTTIEASEHIRDLGLLELAPRVATRSVRSTLSALPEPGQDEAAIKRVDRAVTVLIRGVATRIAGADGAAESSKYKPRIKRIHRAVAVGVAFAGGAALIQ